MQFREAVKKTNIGSLERYFFVVASLLWLAFMRAALSLTSHLKYLII